MHAKQEAVLRLPRTNFVSFSSTFQVSPLHYILPLGQASPPISFSFSFSYHFDH
jgi:hypothetical protein